METLQVMNSPGNLITVIHVRTERMVQEMQYWQYRQYPELDDYPKVQLQSTTSRVQTTSRCDP
jgi:hypothetical protein